MIAPAKKSPETQPDNAELVTLDGNEAAASVAYRLSEGIALYPITPSTPMGELSDEWAAQGRPSIWGTVPRVVQMQSEGGVAGAIHGILQGGAMATTFTASQGLLLMIPDLYKIAGELSPFVLHVAARSIATHALSIFGDHSDVMAVRQVGMGMLASANVQEAHDMAAVAHMATLTGRIPMLHFFDGFRTSHEINQARLLSDSDLRQLISVDAVIENSKRALTPDAPSIRGTAQNPDTFFQAREAVTPYYDTFPDKVQSAMDQLGDLTGRYYKLFEYHGHPEAKRVIILMGSGAETAAETVRYLQAQGEKVGVIQVRLYRPFSVKALMGAIPETCQSLAVLDRTKEPGAVGEPLYQDIMASLAVGWRTGMNVIGGRYGLSSKEFTPAMVRSVLRELESSKPKGNFTIGIQDDVSYSSLGVDPEDNIPIEGVKSAVFYGLGSDGTVGANKNTIKILGENGYSAQAYFVYDSKKSGAVTVSHLRFGQEPIKAPYLITEADFLGCHQWSLLGKNDMASQVKDGGVLLVNSPYPAETFWEHVPLPVQEAILEKKLSLYIVDAYRLAAEAGMGGRINIIMQTAFFKVADLMPEKEALTAIRDAIEKTYRRKGQDIIDKNLKVIDLAVAGVVKVELAGKSADGRSIESPVSTEAPDFVQRVTAAIMMGRGDALPVSAFPVDGIWPTGTTKWEKPTLAQQIPVWDPDICIQCNKCVLVCPHTAVRAKFYPQEAVGNAPETFKSVPFRSNDFPDQHYTIQIAPEDCTGCRLCVEICPAKDKTNPKHKALDVADLIPIRDAERKNFDFFLKLPEVDRAVLNPTRPKESQFFQPLFEFSGACAGCGETPYIKLLTQLCGDRAIMANATGCSSIYGGNLPTTPYTTDAHGRGPAWANSLFEDNAEFGFGLRLAIDKKREHATHIIRHQRKLLGEELVDSLLEEQEETSEATIARQRERVVELKKAIRDSGDVSLQRLEHLMDYLVSKSVWIVGGDGWAYDIGFGGLDHVMAQGLDVNILVLDTEVYSNTGGQQSKSTSLGAVAKFASAGKEVRKKDLGLLAMSYGHIYVARVAFGANDSQTVRAFNEAISYPGTSLIIAYSSCIAHGYSMHLAIDQQKRAVQSGYWPLYRFDPRREKEGKASLMLDSAAPKLPLHEFTRNEARFRVLEQINPGRARELEEEATRAINQQRQFYEELANSGIPANRAMKRKVL